MRHNSQTTSPTLSLEELAQIGTGAVSYIRQVQGHEINRMMGSEQVAPDAKLFCLFNANGSPISVSGSREAASESAFEHELDEVRLN